MRQPLTKRQRELLDYIVAVIEEKGYAPSLQEIGIAHGMTALATVHKHLTNLQEKGYIRRAWNRSRSIEIVPPPECCPECGRPMPEAKAS